MEGHGVRLHRFAPFERIERHVHRAPYAALVLDGWYEEAGEAGRRRVGPGDVVLHAPFSAHLDRMERSRAVVLDLPLAITERSAFARVRDPDAIARIAERDALEAGAALFDQIEICDAGPGDIADAIALGACATDRPLAEIAVALGLARETASRAFKAAYGVSAAQYRGEARARRAWQAVTQGSSPLAQVAVACGYADQAHMTRAVRALTGFPPGWWRAAMRSHSFKSDARPH